ncbi:hypothetical protein Tco_0654551 [Tanacetum coccineum]|uniref:ABC transmembrane type-1 domain-containing protein n=1 Tax=Tanacetum coccineum TaxID=301880 RepID=A0ABQ4X3S6_9ASTR
MSTARGKKGSLQQFTSFIMVRVKYKKSLWPYAVALVSTGLAKLGYKYVNMMIVGLSILVIKRVTQESNERFHVLLTA